MDVGKNDTKRIMVLSDTHNLLRPEVVKQLKGADAIIHCGDIASVETLAKLRELGAVYVVRGNADKEWAVDIPEQLRFELCGKTFVMAHKKKDLPEEAGADVALFGHSHKYSEEYVGGTLYLNPGSCGPRRFNQPITMAEIVISAGDLSVSRIDISHDDGKPPMDLSSVTTSVIKRICADVDKGVDTKTIARKRRIDPDLAENIVRMYLTHPGVSADEIMPKLGL